MRVDGQVVVYRDPAYYASFPAVVRLTDGDLLAVFRRARDPRWLVPAGADGFDQWASHLDPRSHLVALRLDPSLRAVSGPVPIDTDPETADQDASLLALTSGQILLTSFAWHPLPASFVGPLKAAGVNVFRTADGLGFVLWGGFARTSDDGGATFSPRRYLPPLVGSADVIPGKRAYHGGSIRGQAVELGGEILVPAYGVATGLSPASSAHVWASPAAGGEFEHRAVIAVDPSGAVHFHEPALCAFGDGRVVAFMRTQGAEGRLAIAESTDAGRTWSAWQITDVVGHPFHALRLADDTALVTYGYRAQPYGIRGRLYRGGEFLDELIVRDDCSGPDLGYPWAAPLDDDRVAVLYYFTAPDGLRQIEASVIRLR